jgi:hypothetical protein
VDAPAVLGSAVMIYQRVGAWFAIVEGTQFTIAVEAFTVLAVASLGPKGRTPAATSGNAAAGPVPVPFVAVMVKL